jgi:glycyl-tRNA synthetase beta chain
MRPGKFAIPTIEARLKALAEIRPTKDFEPLAASCKRIRNILKQHDLKPDSRFDEALLEGGPERELHAKLKEFRTHKSADYRQQLIEIAGFRPCVDAFFDNVMVNVPDEKIRANRLTLLHTLLATFSTIADFSEIVTSGDQK